MVWLEEGVSLALIVVVVSVEPTFLQLQIQKHCAHYCGLCTDSLSLFAGTKALHHHVIIIEPVLQ